ncbi:MAG TPA: fibronectin type III domain-containing protein [Polyangiaceae bacterium]
MRSRLSVTLTLGVTLSAACAWWGCSSSSSSGNSLTCGPGTVQSGRSCVVATTDGGTRDAAMLPEGGDAGGVEASVVPTFAGVTAVAPASTTSLLAVWQPATEGATPASAMQYRVYVADSSTGIDYKKPVATTVAGATSFYLTGLSAMTTYHVAVRALDPAGNSDTNTVVKSAAPAADTTAPTFAGVTGAMPGGTSAVTLTWAAATDEQTPPAAIVYFVYVKDQLSSSFDFSTPTLVTDPGATTVTVPYLYDPSLVYTFDVRARDAAGNIDTNTATATSRAGADTTPPQFAGCASAIANSAGSAVITWALATDDGTPQNLLVYDVYDATSLAGLSFKKPVDTVTGLTGAVEVTGLTQSTAWHFVVRARDYVGNEDQNLVDCVTTTSADPTPPTFAGVTGVSVQSDARTATFSWMPATDPETPQDEIVYDVFQGPSPGAEDFTAPIATSAAGATSVLATDLTPDSTLYWVVRARDKAGNRDSNTVEVSGNTDVSLSEQIQHTLSSDCAVAGCHVPGNPPLGLVLAPGFAYDYLVNVRSREYPVDLRVNPGDPTTSFLYLKISENPPPVGYQMPAPATGSVLGQAEIDRFRRWIVQGAPNN